MKLGEDFPDTPDFELCENNLMTPVCTQMTNIKFQDPRYRIENSIFEFVPYNCFVYPKRLLCDTTS